VDVLVSTCYVVVVTEEEVQLEVLRDGGYVEGGRIVLVDGLHGGVREAREDFGELDVQVPGNISICFPRALALMG
jgi:hypothetical protein